jgi:hypothetical protein
MEIQMVVLAYNQLDIKASMNSLCEQNIELELFGPTLFGDQYWISISFSIIGFPGSSSELVSSSNIIGFGHKSESAILVKFGLFSLSH